MRKLILKQGPFPGRVYEITKGGVLGRGASAEFLIPDPTMSRQHARLELADGECLLSDLGSGNGTQLNGQRVEQPTPLKDGDVLQLGNVVLEFSATQPGSLRNEEAVLEEASLPVLEECGPPEAGRAARGPDESVVTLTDEGPEANRAVLQEMDAGGNPLASLLASGDSLTAMLDMSRRLQLVYEVGEAISTTLHEDQLLATIMHKLLEVFPQADRGFIMFYNAEKNQLVPKVARTRAGRAAEITVSRSLIREVLAKRKGLLSADAMGDQQFRAGASIFQYGIRSVICVPMLAKQEVLGVIHVDASDPNRPFVKDDMALLLGIAGQAALAIANARLHQRLLHQELLEQDLALANRIQQRFLPQAPPEIPGYRFCGTYAAALEVGGDYYDFIELPAGQLGITVGDVSGKGVSAALYMAKLSSDLRYHAAGRGEPAEILARVHQALAGDVEEGMFVTLIFLALEPGTGMLKVANAGHFPPVIRRANGSLLSWEGAHNPPLGFVEGSTFQQETLQLHPGDSVVIFSDGILEAMNLRDEQFGMPRLLEAIRSTAGDPEEMQQRILASVAAFTRGAPQSDDLTLVCFGRRPT